MSNFFTRSKDDVKSYRNISSKNALTAIKYFNGRISNLNILNKSNPDTISCIRTNIRPISVPQPRLFLFRSFLESSSLFLNKYFTSQFTKAHIIGKILAVLMSGVIVFIYLVSSKLDSVLS